MRRALTQAVRDLLRDTALNGGLALSAAQCELAPLDGRPPAQFGPRFVGVWTAPRAKARALAGGLDTELGVNVTVTVLAGGVPLDRLGPQLAELAGGFDDLVDGIMGAVHMDSLDHRVIRRANLIADATFDAAVATKWTFQHPLDYLGDDGPHAAPPGWLGEEDDESGGESGPAALVCTLRFGGARRCAALVA